MARRRTKKNKNTARVFKIIIIATFAIFLIFLICNTAVSGLKNAEMFKIKEVVRDPTLQFIKSRSLVNLKGKNIFNVDIKRVQHRLQRQYPDIDQLKIERRFPNQIYVTARQRQPFAYIPFEQQDILLDQEGVVLSFEAPSGVALPSIEGIPFNKKAVLGKPLRHQEIDIAVDIINSVKRNHHLSSHRVKSIDVSNLSEIHFSLNNDLRIIIDRQKIDQKITKLGILLSHGNLAIKNVNYIDLRFKEPILSKK